MSQCALGPGIFHFFLPGNCQLKEKKLQMPGGCPGGGGWEMLELTDAFDKRHGTCKFVWYSVVHTPIYDTLKS
jgi:hypothetical protein